MRKYDLSKGDTSAYDNIIKSITNKRLGMPEHEIKKSEVNSKEDIINEERSKLE